MSTAVHAYTAGIVDGEGTIGIWKEARRKNASGFRYRVALEVSNTKERLIDFLVENYGGFKHMSLNGGEDHQPLWKWRCTTSEVPAVLKLIEPYLLIKKQQAQLVKRFVDLQIRFDQRPGKRQSGEVLEHYEALWQETKLLNHRGHSQEPPGS